MGKSSKERKKRKGGRNEGWEECYELLGGLHGVAALLMLWYHVHEGFAFAGGMAIEGINHGYLAVGT